MKVGQMFARHILTLKNRASSVDSSGSLKTLTCNAFEELKAKVSMVEWQEEMIERNTGERNGRLPGEVDVNFGKMPKQQ